MEQEQLAQKLQALRHNQIPEQELYSILHDFGRQRFYEARPDVERFLTHPDPQYRGLALHVLATDWRLPEYWETACGMLLHDPDVDGRLKAASALETLKRNTQDRATLMLLARVVSNQQEGRIVREAAYAAMRGILHFDPREQFRIASKGISEQEVDWQMVRSYLQER